MPPRKKPFNSKSSVQRRTANSKRARAKTSKPGMPHQPFSEQDLKRRLGHFEGSGEAPRKGSRGQLE
jgi:hypothetical protein